jgi:hypothetical protein
MATQQTSPQPGPSSSLSVKTIGSGVLGLVFAVFIAWLVFDWYIPNRKEKRREKAKIQAIADSIIRANQRNFVPPPPPEFSEEGYGIATANSPIKAVLTANTYLYPGGNAIYVDYYDPENYFVDTVINKFGVNKNLWREVLANSNKDRKFLVYPYDKENKKIDSKKSLDFSWSLRKLN